MRELSFEEVRAAGLPAHLELAYVGYEYRPLLDDVAIHIPPARKACGTTLRVPQSGWLHKADCLCSFCQCSPEEVSHEGQGSVVWQEAS